MAYAENQTCITIEAAEDLSASQYHFVYIHTDGKLKLSGEDSNNIGVLQNKPTSGQAATVCIAGVTQLVCAGALDAGKAVGSHSNGKADAHDSLQVKTAVLLEASGGAGEIVSAVFTGANGSIQDIAGVAAS